MQKLYFPFKSNFPVAFAYTSDQQYNYVNSRPLSGSIIIMKFEELNKFFTIFFFFDNASAQISAVNIVEDKFKISQFVEFIETLEKYNLMKAFTFKLEDSDLDVSYKYHTLLIPKNLNRD